MKKVHNHTANLNPVQWKVKADEIDTKDTC